MFYVYNIVGYACPNSLDKQACITVGNYCPPGSVSELPCPSSYYCPSPASKVACVNEPGGLAYYCGEGSSTLEFCEAGFFCQNVTSKVPCPTAGYSCATGSYQPELCADDAVCLLNGADCPAGVFCDYFGNQFVCPPGRYCPNGIMNAFMCPSG